MHDTNPHAAIEVTSPRFAGDHNAHCVTRIRAVDDWWMARILEDRAETAVPPPALRLTTEAGDE